MISGAWPDSGNTHAIGPKGTQPVVGGAFEVICQAFWATAGEASDSPSRNRPQLAKPSVLRADVMIAHGIERRIRPSSRFRSRHRHLPRSSGPWHRGSRNRFRKTFSTSPCTRSKNASRSRLKPWPGCGPLRCRRCDVHADRTPIRPPRRRGNCSCRVTVEGPPIRLFNAHCCRFYGKIILHRGLGCQSFFEAFHLERYIIPRVRGKDPAACWGCQTFSSC